MRLQQFDAARAFRSPDEAIEYCREFPGPLRKLSRIVQANLELNETGFAAELCEASGRLGAKPDVVWSNKGWALLFPAGSRVCIQSALHRDRDDDTMLPVDWGVYQVHRVGRRATTQTRAHQMLFLLPDPTNTDNQGVVHLINLGGARYRTSQTPARYSLAHAPLTKVHLQMYYEDRDIYEDYAEIVLDPDAQFKANYAVPKPKWRS